MSSSPDVPSADCVGSSSSSSSGPGYTLGGWVAPGFEALRDRMEDNLRRGSEARCQVCAYHRGRCVVDLWGSTHPEDSSYGGDSVQSVFSSGKSLECVCVAILADRGLLRYSDPVSLHWPEFGRRGKEGIRVEDVLRHEAGMVALGETVTWEDMARASLKQNRVGRIIEDSSPRRSSATGERAYHAVTRGWILGELLRRVDPRGRTMGEFLRDEVAAALGATVHVGFEDDEDLRGIFPLEAWDWRYVLAQSVLPSSLGRRTDQTILDFARFYWRLSASRKATAAQSSAQGHLLIAGADPSEVPHRVVPVFNRAAARRGEAPSINAHCSARGMARVAACLAGGGQVGGRRILSPEGVESMMSSPTKKKDGAIADLRSYFTQGGVNIFKVFDDDIPQQSYVKGLREGFAGWQGMGGSVMQWHRELEIGFAYVPTLVQYYDMSNTRAGLFQRDVVRCVQGLEED